jgi:hypothetical protein
MLPTVGGVALREDAKEDSRIDDDLHLLRGVVAPDAHQVDVALDLHHVVEDRVEVFALVDVEIDDVRTGPVRRQSATRLVVADRDRRLGPDVDLVALVANFAFVVGVADRCQHGAGVELLDQLARPDLGNERARVGRRGLGRAGREDRLVDRRCGSRREGERDVLRQLTGIELEPQTSRCQRVLEHGVGDDRTTCH